MSRMHKRTWEQGAEENNLGSIKHRVCHKIMVFYTIETFRLPSLGMSSQKYTNYTMLYTSRLILSQGGNSQMSREQGYTKIDLGNTKYYFGEHQENN